MRKIFTLLLCNLVGTVAIAQWTPTVQKDISKNNTVTYPTYSLDLKKMKKMLSEAPLESKGTKPAEIILPDTEGNMHRFAVHSRPVAEKSLADRYGLGSYVGVGIDDASLYARFSLSGNDFQSMLLKDGEYQFIEALDEAKTVYGVHHKSEKTKDGKAFECKTGENPIATKQIEKLFSTNKTAVNNNIIAFSSDRNFRTYRLALAVTGEYTRIFGGVAEALVQMNATMTRVNGIFEKDLALNLIMIDQKEIIYEDPETDPFSDAQQGIDGAWNMELQRTLTEVVGEANYDIGHLFGGSGGGGNAGCIGCICTSPRLNGNGVPTNEGKGAGYTSPSSNRLPQGDTFDIDYVAHELGHQLGANHTFSHSMESTNVQVEPGSGSTIMGYAGITSANVQRNSDAYFHTVSINQVQNRLASKDCGELTPIANTPPVIAPLQDVIIPKGTAFVLNAEVVDAENNPLTYTWEQVDSATSPITRVTGNNSEGALFRSMLPTNSPTRYFPRLSSVLSGTLTSQSNWETVANIARETNFRITVRDNHPDARQQQTQSALQKVTVHENGPFQITSKRLYTNIQIPLEWDVAGTDAAPFNISNVKIDYTANNGVTWVTLSESTPNDGSEIINMNLFNGNTNVKIRVSALGSVFYAIGSIIVSEMAECNGNSPSSIVISDVKIMEATINWEDIQNASYILRYKKRDETVWTEIPTNNTTVTLFGLEDNTNYDVQIATVCAGTTGTYSATRSFRTLALSYCTIDRGNISSEYEYISNVTVTAQNGAEMSNDSVAGKYTNYTNVAGKTINLMANTTNNTISVTKAWPGTSYNDAVKVWIDFNRNGTFEESEIILNTPKNKTTPVTATFVVPADAYIDGKTLRMRVILSDADIDDACQGASYGEIEDYAVIISENLSTNDSAKNNVQIQAYPNPAKDVLNVTNVSDNATYSIYNIAGQLVGNGKISNGKVQVSHLEKGVYIITVNQNDEIAKLKFIKQ